MTYQARLTLAFVAIALIPLGILGYGVRREMAARLDVSAEGRIEDAEAATVDAVVAAAATERERVAGVAATLARAERFRAAVTEARPDDRRWLADWAPTTLVAAGFAMLELQDSGGRVLSAGRASEDAGRMQGAVSAALRASPGDVVVVQAGAGGDRIRALVTGATVNVRGEVYHVIGGSSIDSARVAAFSPEPTVSALLLGGAEEMPPGGFHVMALPLVDLRAPDRPDSARVVLVADVGPALALRDGVTRWILVALGLTVAAALALAAILGRLISAPIIALADRSVRLERAAATGDLARQVNHDIKNGLAPIRNVLRHLGQVAAESPAALAATFAERRATLDSSVEYLDQLARNYARLSPALDRGASDAAAVIRAVASGVSGVAVELRLAEGLPAVRADAVVLHRILDNLVSNAVDAIDGKPGTITIAAEGTGSATERRVRIAVTDTGRGMSRDELDRAFNDFHTTKRAGTGLGLSVVRRLLGDLGGSVRAETAPGKGSTFTVELPAA